MDEPFLSQSKLETDADYQAAIEVYLTEIKRLNEQMDKDRLDIERLREETKAIRARTRRRLSEMAAQ